MTIECTILQKYHRSIMGPKGSRIQQITRDYGVQIKFPDREESTGTVTHKLLRRNIFGILITMIL